MFWIKDQENQEKIWEKYIVSLHCKYFPISVYMEHFHYRGKYYFQEKIVKLVLDYFVLTK